MQQRVGDAAAEEGKKMLEIIILNGNCCLAKSDHAELGFVICFLFFYCIPQILHHNNRDNTKTNQQRHRRHTTKLP